MTNGTGYHARAVLLPDGRDPVDVWVRDGVFHFHPIAGVATIAGRFMSPGLVDSHAHLSIPFAECLAHRHDRAIATGARGNEAELVRQNAKRHVRSGVLAVRDAGYVRRLGIDDASIAVRPIVQRSGWMVVPEGRYFPGLGKDTSPAELDERVREVASYRVQWFKLIADFPGSDLDLFEARPNYPIEVVRRAADLVHAHGMRLMTHSTGRFVEALVEAGVDSIGHGTSMTPAVVRTMAARGIAWAPTLATVEAHLRQSEARGASPESRLAWSARMREALPLAVELGVPVLVGSDEMPHGSIVAEMEAMARHCLTARQVVGAATSVGRAFLRLPGVEPGAPAGFHLSGAAQEAAIPATVKELASLPIARIVPAHCTGWRAVHALWDSFGERVTPVSVGQTHVFEEGGA